MMDVFQSLLSLPILGDLDLFDQFFVASLIIKY